MQASPALKTRKWRPATEDMEGREGRSYRFASLRATRSSLTIAPVNGVVSVGAVVLDPRGHRTAVPVASTARCVSLSTSFHPAAPSNTHTREAAPRHAHQLQPRTATESMHHERAGGLVRVQLQLGETCGEQEDSLRAEALCLRTSANKSWAAAAGVVPLRMWGRARADKPRPLHPLPVSLSGALLGVSSSSLPKWLEPLLKPLRHVGRRLAQLRKSRAGLLLYGLAAVFGLLQVGSLKPPKP